jgi:DNA gyrase subunit A
MANENKEKIGKLIEKDLTQEMKESYIDYAMSVIISRALPDARDGLKPVQRRILYAMYEMGLKHDAKFRKSATVVGETLGKYHPHGDQAVYDAAIRMAQDFTLRYPLIQGQGNVGSIDDPGEYAAMRYTEMRLSKIGEEMLRDIEKETVDFVSNYDGTRKEPVVLPSPLPQLLLNGSLGIAVGMATNIPPHNLKEVCDALIYLIDHPRTDTEGLFNFIQGPDFPTGGFVYNKRDLIEVYSQGRGPILTRGKAEILEDERGKPKILISEIPFQVSKSAFLGQLANLILEKKLEGIKDIRDESDREGMRIMIELSRGAYPKKVLNALYKFSDLQKIFHLNMVALVNGIEPRTLGLIEVLNYFLSHYREVILRRSKYDLERAKERGHILEGIEKCLGKIEEVVRIIKGSKDRDVARERLMKRFSLDKIQANAILETKLVSLAKLEREKIESELKEIKRKIVDLKAILASPKRVNEVIKKELNFLKENFGDERKTKVIDQKVGEISEEDLIPAEETIITLTRGGYIKRTDPKEFRSQKRGGKGILGIKTVGEDVVEHFLVSNTHDNLLFFTDSGKVFKIPVFEIPKAERQSQGRGIFNFLEISPTDKILALISLGKEDQKQNLKFLFFATKNGIIKKTPLEDFKNVRRTGLVAIRLKEGDVLIGCQKSTGEDEVILATKNGQAVRFKEKDVRAMGRTAAGVLGIKLRKGDELIGMEVIKSQILKKKEKSYLLVISENGFGKRTDLKEYRIQKRGGTGIKTAKVTQKTGGLVKIEVLEDQTDLITISKKGKVLKTKISSIPKLSRPTQGVKIMNLEEGDKVASAIVI